MCKYHRWLSVLFSFSGLWMYIRMFRARLARPGQAKWF